MTLDQIRAILETVSRQAGILDVQRRAYVAGAEWVLANSHEGHPNPQEGTPPMTPNTIKRHIAEWRDKRAIAADDETCDAANGAIAALQALLTEAKTPAPGDDEIVEVVVNSFLQWKLPDTVQSDACVIDRDYARKFPGTRSGTNLLTAVEARQMVEHLLAVARPMILRQAAQAAPASTMRSEKEVRAEIEWLGQAASFGDIGYLRALCWVLNEQETGR